MLSKADTIPNPSHIHNNPLLHPHTHPNFTTFSIKCARLLCAHRDTREVKIEVDLGIVASSEKRVRRMHADSYSCDLGNEEIVRVHLTLVNFLIVSSEAEDRSSWKSNLLANLNTRQWKDLGDV